MKQQNSIPESVAFGIALIAMCMGMVLGFMVHATTEITASSMCEKQFGGEMRNGRCVKVEIIEIQEPYMP